ncbi:MAG: polyketide cyclase [Betaproteobacteria bacterium]|nr:polyketide cyclase [Betaproteobacteria bacterium]
MLKIIAVIVIVAIAGVLIFASTKPDTFTVQRSATISAPPEKVFALINDFKQWPQWSPWEKKDPAMKRSYGATTSGQGATYAWEGNGDVGQGSMQITQSVPPSKIVLKLDFVKPMEGHNTVEFNLASAGNTTTVTWLMYGPAPFISKMMQVFINMDSMIGKDFEAGLANLKVAAEKS